VSATASSGLTVSFTTTTPLVCTSGGTNGATITFVTGGTCSVRADQAGDSQYNAAASVTRSFTISKVNQTVTITSSAPVGATVGGTHYFPTATATSGLTVTFTTTTPQVCTVSGANDVSFGGPGTCTVKADQAGDATYNAAPSATQSFAVQSNAKLNQTITFGNLANKTMAQSPVTVSATASSSLTVTFTTTTPLVCTSSGTNGEIITLLDAGTCTVRADQAGDATYNAAPSVSKSFTVTKLSQTITFGALSAKTVTDPDFGVSATASSGLVPVTFSTTTPLVCSVTSGGTVHLIDTGTCTIKADQAGNNVYSAAPSVTQSFAVNKLNQTITFANLANKPANAAPFVVSATASSTLTVTFTTTTPAVCTSTGLNGSTITLVGSGTCTVEADQAGNSTYNAAPSVMRSFTVTKVSQTITFGALANKTLDQSPVTVAATASSGLTVTFSTTTPSVCTWGGANGETITLLAAGKCTVRADQAGNGIYNAATSVNQSFTVSKVPQTITFANPGTHSKSGTPTFALSATATSTLTVTFTSSTTSKCTVSGTTVTLVNTGTCTIVAHQTGNGFYAAAPDVPQSFTVTP